MTVYDLKLCMLGAAGGGRTTVGATAAVVARALERLPASLRPGHP